MHIYSENTFTRNVKPYFFCFLISHRDHFTQKASCIVREKNLVCLQQEKETTGLSFLLLKIVLMQLIKMQKYAKRVYQK